MPVWLSPLFSALSQPVLSFFHLCQTNKSPALFVDFELCDAVMDFDLGMGFPFGFTFCGFCVDFALIFFFFWWVPCMVVVVGCFCGGEVGCCHGSGVGCCRVCRYEVVGVYRDGWGRCREVGCCGQYIHHRVYIHTLLLIYATY